LLKLGVEVKREGKLALVEQPGTCGSIRETQRMRRPAAGELDIGRDDRGRWRGGRVVSVDVGLVDQIDVGRELLRH
jgi:hypothetical protein